VFARRFSALPKLGLDLCRTEPGARVAPTRRRRGVAPVRSSDFIDVLIQHGLP